MIFLYAFLIGGLICAIGQYLLDKFKLMPVHITCLFVFMGALLEIGKIYDKLIKFAGAGASLPISSFGHSLINSALDEARTKGYLGLLTGMFDTTANGITAAIVFAFFMALIFKPKG
jgi:stage V sporulation protein AE